MDLNFCVIAGIMAPFFLITAIILLVNILSVKKKARIKKDLAITTSRQLRGSPRRHK